MVFRPMSTPMTFPSFEIPTNIEPPFALEKAETT
jgi:hypothetical protein